MKYPWEYSKVVSDYFYRRYVNREVRKGTCITELLDDSERQNFRKGDIVRFEFYLRPPYNCDWTSWFYTDEDKKRFWVRRENIPIYASKEIGLVIGRYKKTKYKYAIFRDYGVIVMMLTGSEKGRIKRYWSTRPFKILNRFNEPLKYKYLRKLIPKDIQLLHNNDDSNESRNLFVSKYYENFYGV